MADPLKPVLFAGDTNIIIANSSPSKYKEDTDNINDWFRGNSLSLNFDKTYFLKFIPKNSHEINIKNKL